MFFVLSFFLFFFLNFFFSFLLFATQCLRKKQLFYCHVFHSKYCKLLCKGLKLFFCFSCVKHRLIQNSLFSSMLYIVLQK